MEIKFKLYSKMEYIKLSLLHSKVEGEKFPKFKIDPTFLYGIFFYSLNNEKNIFKLSFEELNDLVDKFLLGYKRKYKRKDSKKIKDEFLFFFREREREKLKREVETVVLECPLLEIKMIDLPSKDYIKKLYELEFPPFILYYKGVLPKEEALKEAIAIVGTREAGEVSCQVAYQFGKELGENNIWNISGLAKGCDEWGHKGSIRSGGKTGGILGQGLGTPIYPRENQELGENILKYGGFLISELPPMVGTRSIFLLERNRLQSGMTRGIFVIETRMGGGTWKTIKDAYTQGRAIYIFNPKKVELNLENNEKLKGNYALLSSKEGGEERISGKTLKKIREVVIEITKPSELVIEAKKEEGKVKQVQKQLF